MALSNRLALFVLLPALLLLPGVAWVADPAGLSVELRQMLALRQYQTAVPELQQLAASGNAEAQYQLALCLLEGNGIEPAPDQAIELLREAAEAKHVKASYLLGSIYYHGKVVEPNSKAAKYYLFEAAQQDHRLAKDLLRHIDQMEQPDDIAAGQAQDALWYAARAGDLRKSAGALSQGADLEARDANGDSALIIALNSRQEAMAIWLIERGAHANATDRSGDTPLHLAARQGMVEVTGRLIAAGAGIDAANQDGRTPLMLAVAQHRADITGQLLAAGASPDQTDLQNRSARDLAAHLGDPAITRLIGKGRVVAAGSQNQRLGLLKNQIAESGSLYQGWPIVAAAVAQDEADLALSLASNGADPWLPAPGGDSAIYTAVERDHDALARALLKVSPVRDASQNAEALRLLALAASQGKRQLVEDLLEIVPPESVKLLPVDQTPIWLAVQAQQTRVVMELMEWQAPDRRTDERGLDLLMLSSQQGVTAAVLGLQSRGFDINRADRTGRSAAWLAADSGHCELLTMLLARGAAVDKADNDGQTVLMRAVLADAPDCVARAIEAGANVDRQTRSGNTALMLAAESRVEIVDLLLAADADYELRNNSSYTALMLAAANSCVACAESLIAAGANPRRKNSKGLSAIDIGAENPQLLAALQH